MDSVPFYDRIKETYGRNLIAAIWPYIESGRITVYGTAKIEKINRANFISGDFAGGESVQVPVYNDNGDQLGTKVIFQQPKPAWFDRIVIKANWYYDETKNIILCNVPEATIHRRMEAETRSPLSLRLIF